MAYWIEGTKVEIKNDEFKERKSLYVKFGSVLIQSNEAKNVFKELQAFLLNNIRDCDIYLDVQNIHISDWIGEKDG